MSDSKIATVYAKALLEIAESKNSFDALEDELKGLSSVLSQNSEIKDFLLSPRVSKKTKAEIFEKSFQGQVSETVLSFLLLVIKNDRSNEFEEIIEDYIILNDARKGLVRVLAYSTVQLGKSELTLIEEWFTKNGIAKHIIIENKLKPEIIGGFVLEYADNIIDNSMRTKLKKLKSYVLSDTDTMIDKDKIGAYYEN
ncbi:MAG: ATP synthase F1 subunit delta [Leptospiraceae bacterium]|nr:ATP synthase F1 subunit delta [Leptospiraceae bacterium]